MIAAAEEYPRACHHEEVVKNMQATVSRWESGGRCSRCWLRSYDCYCAILDERAREYAAQCVEMDVEVVLYYYFLEVGRSGNTGHVLERLLPEATTSLVFGDEAKEQELVNAMVDEHKRGVIDTVVLYPSSDSQLLSEFMEERRRNTQSGKGKKVRLVALDGTYSTARRQCRWLESVLDEVGVPLPVVKLDLSENGCASIFLGVQQQPSLDKISTFQAAAMAINQLGFPQIGNLLLNDIEQFMRHIIRRKVKLGKQKLRIPHGLAVEESELSAFVQEQVQERMKRDAERLAFRQMRSSTVPTLTEEEVRQLLKRRADLRTNGSYEEADRIRKELTDQGVRVKDE
jgi:DTW domain-containing protein YfiP